MIKAVLIVMMFWSSNDKMAYSKPIVFNSVELCEARKEAVMTKAMESRLASSPNEPIIPQDIIAECRLLPGISEVNGA